MLLAQSPHAIQPVGPWLFYIFAGLSVIGALGVVFSQQIVRMAVFLLFTLAGVAMLYFFLDAEFLAAIQLVVYVGGTLILIIFGVMLTSKNPFVTLTIPRGQRALGWLAGFILFLLMTFIGTQMVARAPEQVRQAASAVQSGQTMLDTANYGVADLGRSLLTKYMFPLELAGVLLLVVMIGAAYLAKGRHAEEQLSRSLTGGSEAQEGD